MVFQIHGRTCSRPRIVPAACSTYTMSSEYWSTHGSQFLVCAASSTVCSNFWNAATNSSRLKVLLVTSRTRTRSTGLCRGRGGTDDRPAIADQIVTVVDVVRNGN